MTLEISLTSVLAVIGAVLGCFNTWVGFQRGRTKLIVTPLMARPFKGGYHYSADKWSEEFMELAIRVRNVGGVAVTIEEIGITRKSSKTRMALGQPTFVDGSSLPKRLEPKESFTAYAGDGAAEYMVVEKGQRAYARTQCGRTFDGKGRAFTTFVRRKRA